MFERFTDRARRAVVRAQEESRMLQHDRIGPEHLLLGLVHDSDGLAAKTLESLGISAETVREGVVAAVGTGDRTISGHIPFTPQAKRVLELALREALQIDCDYIGTEHILLGLLREGDGVAAQVLTGLGADLAGTRLRVLSLQAAAGHASPRRRVVALRPGDARKFEERAAALEALSTRTAAIEQWVGLTPDLSELDEQITRVRRDQEAAIDRQDFQAAAQVRDREHELTAERAAKLGEWTPAAPPESEVGRLRAELERLRGLLREHGIDAA
jgi:ATP-dependent Clp protease ATP-binding subunit ClpA